jgi:hypothetical protein
VWLIFHNGLCGPLLRPCGGLLCLLGTLTRALGPQRSLALLEAVDLVRQLLLLGVHDLMYAHEAGLDCFVCVGSGHSRRRDG